MVEKASVDRSSKYKAEFEISSFTSMKKNKWDRYCHLVKVAKDSELVKVRLTTGA